MKKCFTLIELLVVVAIIAVLVAILLPALSSAREAGRKSLCATHVRQMGLSINQYTNDFNGIMPFALYSGQTRIWNSAGHPLAVYFNIPLNLRQMNKTITDYQVYNGAYSQWMGTTIFKCPSEARPPFASEWPLNPWPDYTVNRWAMPDLTWWNMDDTTQKCKKTWSADSFARPSTTLLLADKGWGSYWTIHDQAAPIYDPETLSGGFPYARHRGQLNILFVDLHVQANFQSELVGNGNIFYDMEHMSH